MTKRTVSGVFYYSKARRTAKLEDDIWAILFVFNLAIKQTFFPVAWIPVY